MFVKIECVDSIKYVNADLICVIDFKDNNALYLSSLGGSLGLFTFASPDKRYKELQKLLEG